MTIKLETKEFLFEHFKIMLLVSLALFLGYIIGKG